jgi:hypothetical protein
MKKIERVLCTRRAALLGIAGAVAEIAGCGGGGTGVAGLSSGGTGSFTSGTITGFGSIIVNGIRYNNDTASVLSSDGSVSSNPALQLGMVVSIEGSAVTPASTSTGLATATAYRINYASEWIGPVSNRSSAAFQILGHTVDILSTTFFGGVAQQFPDLTDAHFVEVYGYVDQVDGHIQASRIEVSSVQPTSYKISGAITSVNRTSNTANVGWTSIAWSGSSTLPTGVSGGDFVRVVLNPIPVGSVWMASSVQLLSSPLSRLSADQDYEAEVHGSITAYLSNASLEVNGIPVNASMAQITGTLAAGVQVEVEGNIRSGQLIATKVAVKTSTQVETQEFEFYGVISNVTAQTFVVRGETFYYDGNTSNSRLLSRSPLPYVEVKALRTDGRWHAIEIDLED